MAGLSSTDDDMEESKEAADTDMRSQEGSIAGDDARQPLVWVSFDEALRGMASQLDLSCILQMAIQLRFAGPELQRVFAQSPEQHFGRAEPETRGAAADAPASKGATESLGLSRMVDDLLHRASELRIDPVTRALKQATLPEGRKKLPVTVLSGTSTHLFPIRLDESTHAVYCEVLRVVLQQYRHVCLTLTNPWSC